MSQQKTRKVVRLWKVKDATRPLEFRITNEQVKIARQGDPQHCVVAEGLSACLGDYFDGVEVGAAFTKVYTGDKVTRYRTPKALRKAIPVFDRTGKWLLPPGTYRLLTVDPAHKLGHKKKKSKPKKKVPVAGKAAFNGRPLPTRRVRRASEVTVETVAVEDAE